MKNKNEDIGCVFCGERELVSGGFGCEVEVKCNEKCKEPVLVGRQEESRQQSLFDF